MPIYGIFKNGGLEDDIPFELGNFYVPSKFSVVYLKQFSFKGDSKNSQ